MHRQLRPGWAFASTTSLRRCPPNMSRSRSIAEQPTKIQQDSDRKMAAPVWKSCRIWTCLRIHVRLCTGCLVGHDDSTRAGQHRGPDFRQGRASWTESSLLRPRGIGGLVRQYCRRACKQLVEVPLLRDPIRITEKESHFECLRHYYIHSENPSARNDVWFLSSEYS